MYDDSQIIALLQKRDEKALQIIKEQYGAFCYQTALRIVGNCEDAEECVNDMLLAVWNTVPPHIPVHFRAYLSSLVSRSAIDKFEHLHCQKRGGKQFSAALDELAEIIPSGESIETQIEQRELTAALTAWLRSLSQENRRVFMQRYYLSESVGAVAEKNHMSKAAVKMLLMRLRKKLKEYLKKEGLL